MNCSVLGFWQKGQKKASKPRTPALRIVVPQTGQGDPARLRTRMWSRTFTFRGPAGAFDFGDAPGQDFADGAVEALLLLRGELVAGRLGVYAGGEQYFIGVGVSYGGKSALVHEEDPRLSVFPRRSAAERHPARRPRSKDPHPGSNTPEWPRSGRIRRGRPCPCSFRPRTRTRRPSSRSRENLRAARVFQFPGRRGSCRPA